MTRLTILLTIYSANGQRGGGGNSSGFKQNRLERMFQNEITWLKNNFGLGSVTTEEYSQHDARIFDHWADKLERNKDRMLTRLYKCGGEFNPNLSRIQGGSSTQGGFSEYDEQKLKESETRVNGTEDQDGDSSSVGAGREIVGQPSRGRRSILSRRPRESDKDYELDPKEVEEALKHLDFDYDYPEPDKRFRSRGPQGALELRYEGKKSLGRIRVVLQGFAMWAKNHISECKPKQPAQQMTRASKWFNVLAKKVVGKGKHIMEARGRGLSLMRNS